MTIKKEYNVNDFLAENVKQERLTKEIKITGYKEPFVIQSITSEEFDQLQKQATSRMISKRTYQEVEKSDSNKFTDLLIEKSVVVPNLHDEKLQKSWGCIAEPAKMLRKMISKAGEYGDLLEAISEISGFDADKLSNFVEIAKN
ncbi:phage tail assembly chaperone [Lactobacillus bombicola]|uniref:Phage XkdN-like tail assembly chaperone protein, TAC n=1 Tax=Lactobacillus bombicola TaxID=1505723 RepID=A0ABX9LWQ0_9LACO|nr:hypothetical protein [Lactobacillus bombicola]RHW48994.1 hypothetical protein DS833_05680 [Lactobacillus bombicola]RHW53561.1 hypothetical protein DS834_01085 [Lactobacillus bombicola]